MSYSIIRIERVKNANATTGMQRHNQRENINYSNSDIQKDLTHKNYDLIHGSRNINYNTAIENRIEEGYTGKRKIRKDAIKHVQGIVTSDKAFFDNQSEQDTEKFFKDSLKFIEQKYGKENVLYATVHLDEQTPHMHFGFVPLTEQGKLSAKEVVGNKRELTALQDEYSQFVNQNGYNLQRGTSNEQSNVQHRSVAEYKKETDYKAQNNELLTKNFELRAELAETERTLDERKKNVQDLDRQIADKRRDFEAYQSALQQDMTVKYDIKKEKRLGRETGNIIVSQEDYESMTNDVIKGRRATAVDSSANDSIRKLREDNYELKSENTRQFNQISRLNSEIISVKDENSELKRHQRLLYQTYSVISRRIKGFDEGFNHVAEQLESHSSLKKYGEFMKKVQRSAKILERQRQNELEM